MIQAHGIHPLAGQGVNLGIGDIKQLFEVIDINTLKDDDMLTVALKKYQRRRIFSSQRNLRNDEFFAPSIQRR